MPIRRLFGLLVFSLSLVSSPVLAQTVSFVDESGAPASTYLEKTRVRVRVEDPAANLYPGSVEEIGVSLATALAGDLEFPTLTETGPDTGVFEGSMALDQGPTNHYGVLDTAIQAGPPVVRDTLTVEYEYAPSVTDTAGMVGARIQLLDDYGRPAAGYTHGDWVTVRVEDHVPYNHPGQRGGVTVAVNVPAVSDEEFIVLEETGNATGIFEGRIQAYLFTTYDNDGVVGGPVGLMVHGQYAVTDAQETVDAEAPLVGSRAEILNAAGEPADFVPESSTIRLRAIDRQVGDPYLVDTVLSEVFSEIGQDEETVTLTETVPDSGVFEADLPTSIGATVPESGRLETAQDPGPPHRFDMITLNYNALAGASSDTAVTYGSETLFIDAFGNDAQAYAYGATVHVRVIDHNFDQSAARETVMATVMGLMLGDAETLILTETGTHTAVFEGSLRIEHPRYAVTPGDGQLQAAPGETIEARHTDALGNTASGDRAEIRYAQVEFFDEQGRPTNEVLEGGLALIRLYNDQANAYTYAADTTSVTVRGALTNDLETVQVTETGSDTGIFEGSIRLAFEYGAFVSNGILETRNSGSPDYVQDTVTVESMDAQATAVTVGARIRLIDGFGQDAESFAAGDLVGVRVEDHNVDDPQVRQTVQVVVVVNDQSRDVEAVNALETGYATGEFVGQIASRAGSAAVNDGTLDVQDGDLLQGRHVWSHAPRIATDDALVSQSSVRFVDAQGQPAESYLEASTAWVRLVFGEGNSSPAIVDSVAVTVSAAISQDGESLILTETGTDTGIFTGSIPLRTDPPSPGDGLLQTGRRTSPYLELDTLTVTHATPYGSSSDTAVMGGSRTWFADAYGNPVDSYARKSRAYIRVEDHTYDRPGLWDTVLVTVYSLTTGDQETITLQETARDGGIFAGSLPLDSVINGTTYPYPGDGKLQSDAGEEIEAVHVDGTGAAPSSDRARIDYASIELVDEAGEITFEVLEGGVARLRVYEPYSPFSSTLSVAVESLYGSDRESVTLTETSYQSHVFVGTVQLRSVPGGAGVDFNGVLETSTSGSPEYRADELTAGYNGSTARAVTLPSRVWFIDGFGQVVSSFAVGDRAGVRVEDHNLDDPLQRRSFAVAVRSQGGDFENVTVTETGYDTNVYEGSIATGGGTPASSNGTLQVVAGEMIEAEHGNATTPSPTRAQATITEVSVLFVDEDGNPADVYLEGSRAWLRVAYAGTNPADVNSIPVTLRTTLGTDVESLLLTETGPATGVFTGSIALTVSGTLSGDGRLTTVQDPGPPHELDTLRAEYYGASDTVATISSRTWFIDAWGNLTDSYARNSRAYVRVEDHTSGQPGVYDTVQVTGRSLVTGDQETLTLLETARDSGIFEGSLPLEAVINGTTYPYPGDGKLQADSGQEIEARHIDWTGSTSSSDRARIDYGSVEIVDEAGALTFEVLENGVARLRVFEPYNPYGNTVGASVRSLRGDDAESVTLTQTSYGSQIYEGTVQLRSVALGAGTTFNGVFETATSGDPEYLADEMTAMYGDDEAVAVVLAARGWFIDLFGREVSSFAVGDRVGVRIENHKYDDPLLRRTIFADVSSERGDFQTLALVETGYDTNVYEGSIASSGGTPASSDGVLQIQANETIEAKHTVYAAPAVTLAQATITAASVLFVDADGAPAGLYLEGSRAYVRVADDSAASSVTATLRTTLGADVESLLLTETGPNTAVFTGSIALGVLGLSPNDGRLTTVQDLGTPHEYDTLRVEYNGATDMAATISSRTWFVDAYGNLTDSYARSSQAYVRVEDHTFDQPGVSDTVQVTLRSLVTGDQETLTLVETGLDGGIFEGSLPLEAVINGTTYPYPGDGKLQSDGGEEIEARHTDWTGSTSSSDRARIDYGSIEIVDAAGVVTFEVLENGVARLRVFEPYNPYGNTVNASVRSLYGGDAEGITLTETSYGSQVYEGTVQLQTVAPGSGSTFNGVFQTSTSGSPEHRQEEITAMYGDDEAVAVVLASRVQLLNLQGQAVAGYAVGSAVRVRVEDHNTGSAGQVDTMTVNVSTPADAELLTLTETGPGTGVFEGSLPGSGNTPVSADGTLQSAPGVTVTAEHGNANTPAATLAQALFSGNFAPLAVNDTAETLEAPIVIAVLANDSDPDAETLQVASVTQGANGAVAVNGNQTVTYTPAAGFVGSDAFTYVAADPRGGQARATVTVTVINDNAPPAPVADTAVTDEDQAVNIAVLANDTDPDNDPLEMALLTQPASGTATLEPDKTITYTPNPNFTGTDAFTYEVEDPDGETASATVNVSIVPVNDPPVAVDDAATAAEDSSVTVTVLANDTDVESDTLDVTAVTQGANGAVVLNGNDTVTYTPSANFSGTDSFTYTISDGNGGTDTATVAVTVTPANDPPVAADDTATTDEDTAVTVTVLANDTDADNDTLNVVSTTGVTNGSAVVNANETITFTPAEGFHGTVTFDYSITDGNGGSDVGTVTITVNPVNDAPVANNDIAIAEEDSSVTVNVLANDSDADNDTIDVTAVTQGTNGSVTLNPVTYTPNANFHGTDSFTYTVSDGNGGSDTASVNVTVNAANDTPVANDDAATVAEDSSVTVNVLGNDSDADNDTLTVSSVTQGTNGTVTLNPVTYTPNASFHGTDSFTYTVSDGTGGGGGTDTATVTVTVTPVNDAPEANDDTASVVEDDSVTVNVLGNDTDVDNDTLTVTAVTQGANGAVTLNPVTYTPSPNFFGTDSFTYTIGDGNGGADTATVTVTIAPSNDNLTAVDDTATVAEDGSVTVAVLGNDSDPENDVLSVQSVTQGTNGSVAIVGSQVTYTPNAHFHGADSFTYTASDGNGGTDSATVTITVTSVNDAPVAGNDTASVVEDGSVAITVLGNDADVDEDLLSVTSVTQGANGSVVINPDDTVTYTPEADFNGTDSFTYTLSDGEMDDTATVTVTVGAANDAPIATNDSASTSEDNPVTVSVLGNDNDPENDTLSVATVTQGANGAAVINANNTVTYTPAAHYNGTDSFTYTASDGNGGTDTATVTVTISSINDAPVANDDPASVAEDGSVTVAVLANDTDADNDTLSVTAVTQGAHGTVTLNPVAYTPAANYNGTDTFTYTISDGNGGTDIATVNVTVGSTNDAPVANDDTATVAEDGSVTIPVLTNDTDLDNDTLTVISVTQPANGTVTMNPVTYMPNANFFGTNSFTYTASDGNGGTDTATVTVTVTAVNDAPAAVNDSATTLAETAVTVQVRTNDTDVEGNTLTITAVTQGAHGSVVINAGQSVTYTPATAWIGPDTFTYTISDGAGGTSTATVNVTVQAPPRVSTNIQVLYAFNEGSGTTVNDTSGVGMPLNLTVANAAAVTWLPGALSINSNTLVQSAGVAAKVINASKASNEVTVEAWVDPLNLSQTGPAAIVTVSQTNTKRNVTLGQSGTAFSGQLRTSTTGQDGTQHSANNVATTNLTHVVYTRSSTGAVRIYVNGNLVTSATLTGNLSTWANYNLALGGELSGTRYWRGEMHLVAIYSRALTAAEARQNFLAGAN